MPENKGSTLVMYPTSLPKYFTLNQKKSSNKYLTKSLAALPLQGIKFVLGWGHSTRGTLIGKVNRTLPYMSGSISWGCQYQLFAGMKAQGVNTTCVTRILQ